VNLGEFITQALVQIANGMKDAEEGLERSGAPVNPRDASVSTTDGGKIYGYMTKSGTSLRAIQLVEFDVAVTATDGKESKGGIGVVMGAIALGSTAKTDSQNSPISRLRFSIPIALPNGRQS
jgi:hypothetical protein